VRQYATPPLSYDGLNWSTAFPSIDAAFASGAFLPGDQLWVAASGATPYHPTQNIESSDERTVHFEIGLNFFSLKGGFPPNPPDGWNERDISAHPTVLSGDLDDDDPPYDPATYVDSHDHLLNNAYRVVKVVGVGNSCLIDGFVIRDGHNWTGVGPDIGGPGYIGHGGGMQLMSETPGQFATPFIQNCRFLDNFAARVGGGLSVIAKPVGDPPSQDPEDYPSLVKIRTCEFRANRVKNVTGGAIELWAGGLDMAGTLVADNFANSHGSGIHAFMPKPLLLTNCTVSNNNGSHSASGIAVGKSPLQPPEPELPSDPALNIFIVRNSIVSGNRDDQLPDGSGDFTNQLGPGKLGVPTKPQVDYSIVFDSVGPVTYGVGNQTTPEYDPDFFFDRENEDVLLRDYRVTITSWCGVPIDRGDPVTTNLPADERDADDDGNFSEPLPDVRLEERVEAGIAGALPRVDVGAYEMKQEDLPLTCQADVDLNGTVGASDLAILLGQWSQEHGPCALHCCTADFSLDGNVDARDLAILLGAWGPCPVPNPMESSFLETEFALLDFLEGSTLAPQELSGILGFASLESFADWLGSMSPEARAAVLAAIGLSGGISGGEL
jgi:hypothetical protein